MKNFINNKVMFKMIKTGNIVNIKYIKLVNFVFKPIFLYIFKLNLCSKSGLILWNPLYHWYFVFKKIGLNPKHKETNKTKIMRMKDHPS